MWRNVDETWVQNAYQQRSFKLNKRTRRRSLIFILVADTGFFSCQVPEFICAASHAETKNQLRAGLPGVLLLFVGRAQHRLLQAFICLLAQACQTIFACGAIAIG